MSGTALVTGAAGNVGSEVVKALLEAGVTVRATMTDDRESERIPTGCERVAFDFCDASTFPQALRHVDRVFLMRPPHMSDAKAFLPFLAAMREAGVAQVVFLSLLGAEKNPVVPHHSIERELKKSGLAWTMLRPSFFMQNLCTTHMADIRERDEIIVPAGSGRTSFIDVRDIAAAAARVLTEPGHEGQSYSLTGEEALDYDECAAILSDVVGRPITYTRPSGRAFAEHMRTRGYPAEFVSVMRAIYMVAKMRMAATVTTDLHELLGRRPISFRQFAEDNRLLFSADA